MPSYSQSHKHSLSHRPQELPLDRIHFPDCCTERPTAQPLTGCTLHWHSHNKYRSGADRHVITLESTSISDAISPYSPGREMGPPNPRPRIRLCVARVACSANICIPLAVNGKRGWVIVLYFPFEPRNPLLHTIRVVLDSHVCGLRAR